MDSNYNTLYNPLPSIALISALLITTLIVFSFIHTNYKKYTLFSTLNEMLMFRKMLFNKKMAYYAGKKIIISHLFIASTVFIYLIVINNSIYIGDLFAAAVMGLIFVLIIRLIYEFVVIPIVVNNGQAQAYQQNVYMQQTNINGLDNISPVQTTQKQESIAPENQFKFCSQCGTRYDMTKDNCPNCGMK